MIALLSATVGYYGGYPELYLIAVLTAMFRGLLIPYLLRRVVFRLDVNRELHPAIAPSSALVLGSASVLFAFVVAQHIGSRIDLTTVSVMALTIMLSKKLLGFLMLAIRREAISMILGVLVLENGIFLGSQLLIPGMPLLIELVVLFDLLVIVASFGVLVRLLMVHVGTTDSRDLNRLVG